MVREKLSFTKLRIWQKAHKLTLKIYSKWTLIAKDLKYPGHEKYDQITEEYLDLTKNGPRRKKRSRAKVNSSNILFI